MENFGSKGFDWVIFVCILLLGGLGTAIVGSAAPELLASQVVFYLLGLGLFIFFANVDYRIFGNVWRQTYIISLVLLGVTLLMGLESRGATRWISILGFRLQFSEILKPFLLACVAVFLGEKEDSGKKNTLKHYGKAILLGLIPTLLIFRQPDLGSALVYFASLAAMVFVSGISFSYVLIAGSLAAIFLPLTWYFLAGYQKARLLSFFNPNMDPLGASYNAIQATIAVGSGLFFGWGLGRGTQSQLLFLPERHTDFVFAALAEELGFVGATTLLIIYFVLIWQVFRISARAPDRTGKLLAAGIGIMFLGQTFINIGMNLGILPVTGITLPLISYGGSSVLATMISLGIVENIASARRNEI